MPKHRETSVVSSLEKAHPVHLQAASDPYAAGRPYYALHASARNKGLCPHSDNHQLRWWLCSFTGPATVIIMTIAQELNMFS